MFSVFDVQLITASQSSPPRQIKRSSSSYPHPLMALSFLRLSSQAIYWPDGYLLEVFHQRQLLSPTANQWSLTPLITNAAFPIALLFCFKKSQTTEMFAISNSQAFL
jgi:hypothetical protein